MRVLITGAAGMLGRDLSAAFRRSDAEVTALSRAELDIVDSSAVTTLVGEVAPDVIVNCAAWTDVDGAEEAPEQAHAVNGAGAGNIAHAAAQSGAFIVHVSSDYVFDGLSSTPYSESDPTDPQSVYGHSKLAGELAVAKNAPEQHAIVRSSWLFGLHGSNFVDTILKKAESESELSVVDDQVGCPTWTGHLAEALADIAVQRVRGVLHVAGAGSCSWFDLAKRAIEEEGIECSVTPVTSDKFPRPAKRPSFSVLQSTRSDVPALPHWTVGLSEYLKIRKGSVPRDSTESGSSSWESSNETKKTFSERVASVAEQVSHSPLNSDFKAIEGSSSKSTLFEGITNLIEGVIP